MNIILKSAVYTYVYGQIPLKFGNYLIKNAKWLLIVIFLYFIRRNVNKTINSYLTMDKYTKNTKAVLDNHGNNKIQALYLLREPVTNLGYFCVNICTLNKLTNALNSHKEKTGEILWPMHVGCIFELKDDNGNTYFVHIEKNSTINVTKNINLHKKHEYYKITLTDNKKLNVLLDEIKNKMGDKLYYNWHITKNNCQRFIIVIMNNLNVNDYKAFSFIHQPFFTNNSLINTVNNNMISALLSIYNACIYYYY